MIDSSSLHGRAFKTALKSYSIDFDYASVAGLRTDDAFEDIFKNASYYPSKKEIRYLVALKQKIFRESIAREIKFLPEVEKFLEWARKNFSIAVVSSGSKKSILLSLKALGKLNFFDYIISGEDVNKPKPDPECFLKAKQLFNCSVDDAIIFEDSASGIKSAIASGIKYIDVREKGFSWSHLIRN